MRIRFPRGHGALRSEEPAEPAGGMSDAWPLNGPTFDRGHPSLDHDGVGHGHLYWLLRVHAIVGSDGVTAARRELTTEQLAKAVNACGYFDLCELANMLADVPRAASSLREAEVFDARYRRRYVTTGTVATAIRAKITERPRDFPSDNVQ